ncbi:MULTISPECIES: hypothetical protein [Bacillaceae]|jgi:hypothetical protein|uniref:Uncharacterized protein n=1 Tax=Gottfriedia acidiceleris TaxID=371036 RepID=A0ABY4JFN1_9BACI|nr:MULTISPECIES: hypothetical protein [Bacillaceae]KQL32915.1 hypothetical protein AN960_23390 [Bacillus sp. FJAT-25509]PEC48795.1 hypothetical protein CON00_14545 [Bacillus sp. AFS096315]PET64484.1 hypothetical protein CN514_12900 [Bacillus sp. AFS001701]PFH82592.1 hypothetical protein COI44_19825 [Bacillus sp. AFS088145]PFM82815.1 hypothetical protein COJ46_03120 [Bacillus sp. AFS077874]
MATLQINGTVNEINEVLKVMSNHFDIQIKDEKSDQEYSVDFSYEEWENDSFVSEMLTGAYND